MPTNMARYSSGRVHLPDLPPACAPRLIWVEMGVGRVEKAPLQALFSIFGGEGKSYYARKPAWILSLNILVSTHTVNRTFIIFYELMTVGIVYRLANTPYLYRKKF
jgi:hypothetical protein